MAQLLSRILSPHIRPCNAKKKESTTSLNMVPRFQTFPLTATAGVVQAFFTFALTNKTCHYNKCRKPPNTDLATLSFLRSSTCRTTYLHQGLTSELGGSCASAGTSSEPSTSTSDG
uniref:Uncharacterized protein n=1 Tax=Trypanosoma congolense (strain IL3000) TaxID=1068625 RepID=G0USK3_TRYCI|nr:hypothetical protein TCIL3000_8_5920 [Trypanosoma congolense IL3000]